MISKGIQAIYVYITCKICTYVIQYYKILWYNIGLPGINNQGFSIVVVSCAKCNLVSVKYKFTLDGHVGFCIKSFLRSVILQFYKRCIYFNVSIFALC